MTMVLPRPTPIRSAQPCHITQCLQIMMMRLCLLACLSDLNHKRPHPLLVSKSNFLTGTLKVSQKNDFFLSSPFVL